MKGTNQREVIAHGEDSVKQIKGRNYEKVEL